MTEHVNVWEPGHTIIIRPTKLISFSTMIYEARHRFAEHPDTQAREAVENNHNRVDVARYSKGE